MKYQLVLQFAAASTEDFDRLLALEDSLIGELGTSRQLTVMTLVWASSIFSFSPTTLTDPSIERTGW